MNARFRWGLLALGLMLISWAAWGSARSEVSAPQSAAPKTPPASLGFAGTASCSAQACHGRANPVENQDVKQNEYLFCLTHDKHTQAYAVLKEERAEQMARNLAVLNGGEVIPAHEDARCLACHATPQSAPLKDVTPQVLSWRQEGVSCEACHGPALGPKPWLQIHTAPSQWREAYARNPQDPVWKTYDFNDLSDLATQAKVCAGCHVGAPPDSEKGIPARDCNHDIMAAGHPRLNFELTVYRANMPPHWNVEKDTPASEAKSWAVGRVATARAALELLVHRAENAETSNRWPEFADYRCFACHADLHPGWKDRKLPAHRPVGSFPLDPWYSAQLPALSKALPGASGDVAQGYAELTGEMAKGPPDPKKVIDSARKLIATHDAWLSKLEGETVDAGRVLRGLASEVKALPPTWEEATQLTLAIAALKRDALLDYYTKARQNPNQEKPPEIQALEALAKALAFPEGAESPAGFQGPPTAEKKLDDQFQTLLEALRK